MAQLGVTSAMVSLVLSAFMVGLGWGRELLLKNFPGMSLSTFYFPSAVWLAITLVPWCACMGATFPFMMAAIRQEGSAKAAKSFSFLYLPNIIGATAGA